MPSGSGTSGQGNVTLYAGTTTDTRLFVRFPDVPTDQRSKVADIYVLITLGGQQYLWQSRGIYGLGRAIIGIPTPSSGGVKRFILRQIEPGLSYTWETQP